MAASPGSGSTSSISSAARSDPVFRQVTEGPREGAPGRHRSLYGRRRGRALRLGQRGLKEQLLPALAFFLPEPGDALAPAALFPGTVDEVWLEIGFGAGEHLAAQAETHRAIGFIGCEVFENGIVKLLGEVQRRDLTNIRLFPDDGRLLLERLHEASIGRAFVLFPDPWPKLRHHKRRLVSLETLDALARVLRDDAELRLATDDPGYLRWMLERALAHADFEWLARRPGDWRERPGDWPQTRYEAKAIAAGRAPAFLRLRRRKRP
jgi:tRNA (guanine-N7-)-methyltransferase